MQLSVPIQIHLGTIEELIVFPLVLYVLANRLFIGTDGIHEVPSRPEGLLGTPEFTLGTELMNADGTLPLQEAHDEGDRVLGRDFEEKVDVIGTGIAFENLAFSLLGEFSNDLPDLDSDWSVEDFLPVFGYDDDVVLAVPHHVTL